ncbi:hypothetical protein J6590_020803 [Homalodisca vitripennis]|nr:hypothetical protein J6590_020803 [Homalodisca vitripennis]
MSGCIHRLAATAELWTQLHSTSISVSPSLPVRSIQPEKIISILHGDNDGWVCACIESPDLTPSTEMSFVVRSPFSDW